MSRMAQAMGCKVVYGIVPEGGKKLEDIVEEKLWRGLLEDSETASQQVSDLAS
jgi:hypothetical protein